MNIALLNEKVTFQKSKVKVDDIGNRLNVWEDYFSCYGTISGENGAESENAGTTNDHAEMYVTVRWCRQVTGISPLNFRLVFHDEVFDIIGIDHMNYKKICLKFRCRKERRDEQKDKN